MLQQTHDHILYYTINASHVKLDDIDSYLFEASPASHDAADDNTSYFVANLSLPTTPLAVVPLRVQIAFCAAWNNL